MTKPKQRTWRRKLREIKFRAWHKKDKKMLKVENILLAIDYKGNVVRILDGLFKPRKDTVKALEADSESFSTPEYFILPSACK